MQTSKVLVLVVISVLMVAVLASAGDKLGIATYQKISFTGNVRVGDVVMPQGDYEVKHVMEGENHIMVFSKLGAGKAASFRVKCSLVSLGEKSKMTEKKYTLNAANEQVLQEIVFRATRRSTFSSREGNPAFGVNGNPLWLPMRDFPIP